MSDAVNDDPIIIDIENSLDASGRFETNNLLQRKAIGKIQRLIKSRLEKVQVCDHRDCENDRRHDTITILGERGSGKTSLLLNLETILVEHKNDLVFLKIIDPTLFETKQNILVSIISLIADKVKDKNKEADENWNESLIKLADGLKLLDGVGSDIIKSDLFDDGALILEKGLDHAHSGLNLEKYLNCYIVKSLSLLDKKMFVLIFDDIDTNIDKGWIVLEAIRKYLTSCQMQVFVSGDWGLYSSLVRMKQWENFDRKVLPEKEWHDKEGLIDQLEEQYLIKVLKPEYRIYLENLYQLTKKTEPILLEGFGVSRHGIESIYRYVSQILFNFQNESQKQDVSDLIKQLPIRTNMKIFYAQLENQNNVEELINAISNVFITNTARFNFTHLDYENLPITAILQEMAKKLYLLSNEKFSFSSLSQFPLNLNDNNLNLLLMVINLHLIRIVNTSKYTFFEWLTRFTYLEMLGKNKRENDEKNALLSRLKYDSKIFMKEQLDLISDEYSAQTTTKSLLPGFKSTYAFHGVAKEYGHIGIDKFKESTKLDEHFLLSVMSIKSVLVGHSQQTSVSLISIFSFLSEFLQKNIQDAETYLFSIFEEFHHVKTEDQVFEVFHEERTEEIINNNIYKSLLEWHKLQDKVQMFSVSQIKRIWEEFVRKQIAFDLQNQRFATVKDFMSIQSLVFLNLLAKEVLFNKNTTKAYDILVTPTNLYRNIEKAYGQNYRDNFYSFNDNFDFFKYMYMCPILYCLIDDANFIIPDERYWIGDEDKNRILTVFGKLGIYGESLKKDKSYEVEKYISISDLRKVTAKELSTIDELLEKIKSGALNSITLWDIIKPPRKRITPEKSAILKRLIANIQNDIKSNDSSAN